MEKILRKVLLGSVILNVAMIDLQLLVTLGAVSADVLNAGLGTGTAIFTLTDTVPLLCVGIGVELLGLMILNKTVKKFREVKIDYDEIKRSFQHCKEIVFDREKTKNIQIKTIEGVIKEQDNIKKQEKNINNKSVEHILIKNARSRDNKKTSAENILRVGNCENSTALEK
ncbi:MAG: hypothetical protein J6Y29_06000 [Clostridiales bacterium]|nr:hypothetical protein [Clostridiales bacterium]